MELALVEDLVLKVQMSKQVENGFKRESFVRMQTGVNLKNCHKLLDVQQVKRSIIWQVFGHGNTYHTWKQRY